MFTVGCRVRVLRGRHFPTFQERDEGDVLEVDEECRNCRVRFDGHAEAVQVALKHLRVVGQGGEAPPPLQATLLGAGGPGGAGGGKVPTRSYSLGPVASVGLSNSRRESLADETQQLALERDRLRAALEASELSAQEHKAAATRVQQARDLKTWELGVAKEAELRAGLAASRRGAEVDEAHAEAMQLRMALDGTLRELREEQICLRESRALASQCHGVASGMEQEATDALQHLAAELKEEQRCARDARSAAAQCQAAALELQEEAASEVRHLALALQAEEEAARQSQALALECHSARAERQEASHELQQLLAELQEERGATYQLRQQLAVAEAQGPVLAGGAAGGRSPAHGGTSPSRGMRQRAVFEEGSAAFTAGAAPSASSTALPLPRLFEAAAADDSASLMAALSDGDARSAEAALCAKDKDGRSLLHVALASNAGETSQLLLRQAQRAAEHRRYLHRLQGELLQRSVAQYVNCPDSAGCSPLAVLAKCRQEPAREVVTALLEAQADPWHRDCSGVTPFIESARSGNLLLSRFLLQVTQGEALYDVDYANRSGLHWAAQEGHAPIVEFLLKARAQADIADDEGKTAVDCAKVAGHMEVSRLLLPVHGGEDEQAQIHQEMQKEEQEKRPSSGDARKAGEAANARESEEDEEEAPAAEEPPMHGRWHSGGRLSVSEMGRTRGTEHEEEESRPWSSDEELVLPEEPPLGVQPPRAGAGPPDSWADAAEPIEPPSPARPHMPASPERAGGLLPEVAAGLEEFLPREAPAPREPPPAAEPRGHHEVPLERMSQAIRSAEALLGVEPRGHAEASGAGWATSEHSHSTLRKPSSWSSDARLSDGLTASQDDPLPGRSLRSSYAAASHADSPRTAAAAEEVAAAAVAAGGRLGQSWRHGMEDDPLHSGPRRSVHAAATEADAPEHTVAEEVDTAVATGGRLQQSWLHGTQDEPLHGGPRRSAHAAGAQADSPALAAAEEAAAVAAAAGGREGWSLRRSVEEILSSAGDDLLRSSGSLREERSHSSAGVEPSWVTERMSRLSLDRSRDGDRGVHRQEQQEVHHRHEPQLGDGGPLPSRYLSRGSATEASSPSSAGAAAAVAPAESRPPARASRGLGEGLADAWGSGMGQRHVGEEPPAVAEPALGRREPSLEERPEEPAPPRRPSILGSGLASSWGGSGDLRRRMEALLSRDSDGSGGGSPPSRRHTAVGGDNPLGLGGSRHSAEDFGSPASPPHAGSPQGAGSAEDALPSWLRRSSAPTAHFAPRPSAGGVASPSVFGSRRAGAEELLPPEEESPRSEVFNAWAGGSGLPSPHGGGMPPEGVADPWALDRDLQRKAKELLGTSSPSFSGSRRSWFDRDSLKSDGRPEGRASLWFSGGSPDQSAEEIGSPASPAQGAARLSSSSGSSRPWFHSGAGAVPEALY